MIQEEDEKFDEGLRKGRIAAETLKKPMTFFEAVEALKLPKIDESAEDKKQALKAGTKKRMVSLEEVKEPTLSGINIDMKQGNFLAVVG